MLLYKTPSFLTGPSGRCWFNQSPRFVQFLAFTESVIMDTLIWRRFCAHLRVQWSAKFLGVVELLVYWECVFWICKYNLFGEQLDNISVYTSNKNKNVSAVNGKKTILMFIYNFNWNFSYEYVGHLFLRWKTIPFLWTTNLSLAHFSIGLLTFTIKRVGLLSYTVQISLPNSLLPFKHGIF